MIEADATQATAIFIAVDDYYAITLLHIIELNQ